VARADDGGGDDAAEQKTRRPARKGTGRAYATEAADRFCCFLVLLNGGYADFHEAGLRWSRTYSSVPVLPAWLVPDGWQESYGLDWVGQPV